MAVGLMASVAATFQIKAQVPVASYRWNFDQSDINSSNRIFVANPAGWHSGDVVNENPSTQQGELGQFDQNGNSVNFLAGTSSGVSSGLIGGDPVDRALLMPANGSLQLITRTPNKTAAITNLGMITNFSLTFWMRETISAQAEGTFPRFFMLGPDGIDCGNPVTNGIAILIYSGNDIQLKINNVSSPDGPPGPGHGQGITTGTGPLSASSTNWVFIAVTCDMTLPTGGVQTGGTNTWFYIGDRADSFLGATLGANVHIIPLNYDATSINSVAPAATDGPGFVNFNPTLFNGDGTTFGVSNVYVAIGNRYFQNSGFGTPVDDAGNPGAAGGSRPFTGDFDDIRLFANKVLTLNEVEAVRTNAPVAVGLPLTITQQPQNTTVAEGQGAGFIALSSEAGGLSYQWYVIPHGAGTVSNAVAGATNDVLETGALSVAVNNGDKYGLLVHSTDPSSDNGGKGIFSQYATVTVVPTNAYVTTPGMLKFEYYRPGANGAGGDSVPAFLAAPPASYPNAPDQTLFISSFDSRTVFPDDTHSQYFVRVTGWITPTVTTNYVFYIRAGSQGQLLLSTDDTTNNLVDIADDTQNGPQLFYGPEEQGFVSAGQQYSAPIALQAGSNYAVVAYLKSSQNDNFLQVAWRMNADFFNDLPTSDQGFAERLQPIPSSALSCSALPRGTATITQQPANPGSVTANSAITLSIGATAITNNGSGPLVVQWQKNGTNIDGASGPIYTTPYLSTNDNGSTFDAVVSFPGFATNSHVVTVNVTSGNTAPKVLSAISGALMHSVTVQFSEPLDPTTATNPANYSIPGLNVLNATFTPTTNEVDNPLYDAIRLTTTGQTDNTKYTVTVHNVQDTTGHTISAGNAAAFTSLGFLPGFSKFSWYEDQNYQGSLNGSAFAQFNSDDGTVLGFLSASPKYLYDDPDTIVYPTSPIMSPQGNSFFRNANTAGRFGYPPGLFATRVQAIITPTNTGNYVFYLAAADTGILYLSTDTDPTNKHVIAYSATAAATATTWSHDGSQTIDTNSLMGEIGDLQPQPTPWPVTDQNGIAVITLIKGQRYYMEADQRESIGGNAFLEVNWDNATGVAPADGTATALNGNFIGWHFTQPQITAFGHQGNNVAITWTTNRLTGARGLGAIPWPGVIVPDTSGVSASFPPGATLQTALQLNGTYIPVTNNSPATFPTTNASQFFRLGQ